MHKAGRAVKHHDIYLIDDRLICKLLADLRIYDDVPSLAPLKGPVLKLTAHMTKLRETTRGALRPETREKYQDIVRHFHRLFKPSDYDALRTFLLRRKWVNAKTIVFADSPY